MTTLTDLPADLILQILGFTDFSALIQFGRTNSELQRLVVDQANPVCHECRCRVFWNGNFVASDFVPKCCFDADPDENQLAFCFECQHISVNCGDCGKAFCYECFKGTSRCLSCGKDSCRDCGGAEECNVCQTKLCRNCNGGNSMSTCVCGINVCSSCQNDRGHRTTCDVCSNYAFD